MSEGRDRPPQIDSRAPLRPRKPRPSRGKGLRVTTGCVVCRIRHVKCDEAQPGCGPCAKSNRECVYGTVSNVPHRRRAIDLSENSTKTTASPEPSQAVTSEDHKSQNPTPEQHISAAHHQRLIEDVRTDHNPAINFLDRGRWSRSMGNVQTSSPHSSLSGTSAYPVNVAPLQRFGLLSGNANKANWSRDSAPPRFLKPSVSNAALPGSTVPYVGEPFVNHAGHNLDPSPSSGIPQEIVTLSQYEVTLFTHFVKVLSRWIDLADPHQHFSVMVPHIAMRNRGLMKAILALCARHLSINQLGSDLAPDRNLAVQYYYETLGYVQQAMKDESYLRSEELLVTVLMISTYEMIDGAGQGWERHLKGVFYIQRSREINGESGGLEQAIWWAWIRQDAWVAFRERRKVLSFFKPTKPYHAMDHWDIAARCLYLLAQSINYSSKQEVEAGKFDPRARLERADEHLSKLEEWYQHLTGHFNPLPCLSKSEGPFEPIWIHPPVFAHALQMFHCAKIFLLVWAPATGGLRGSAAREQSLNGSIDIICGIAMATTDDAACLSSTQCVYAAGIHVKDLRKRAAVSELIRSHQSRTGWPLQDLRIDLEAEWKKETCCGLETVLNG